MFGGYYILLFIFLNLIGGSSTIITIPIRVLILVILFFLMIKRNNGIRAIEDTLMKLLSFLYVLRIFYELFRGNSDYHISTILFLFYFLGFVFIPYLLISNTSYEIKNLKLIYNSILYSSVLFALSAIYFYSSFIGQQIGRISNIIDRDSDNYFSPLSMSACGALGFLLSLSFFMTTKEIRFKKKILVLLVIFLCFIPLILGSSKGSFVALLIAISFIFFYLKGFKKKIWFLVFFFLLIIIASYLIEIIGSNIIVRFMDIGESIDTGKRSSGIRVEIWKACINQFIYNPIFGNSLESEYLGAKPHNIFLEIMVSTGLFGLIPFLFLIWRCFKIAIKIVKKFPLYSWISGLFIFNFIISLFSGSLYSATWLFISIALLISFKKNILSNNISNSRF